MSSVAGCTPRRFWSAASSCVRSHAQWRQTPSIAQSPKPCRPNWQPFVCGDIHELPRPRDPVGHEQAGRRFAVVIQSDDLELSTVIVAPTSTKALDTSFRPAITVIGQRTAVLLEQMTAVDPARLGCQVGRVDPEDMRALNDAIRRVLAVDLPW